MSPRFPSPHNKEPRGSQCRRSRTHMERRATSCPKVSALISWILLCWRPLKRQRGWHEREDLSGPPAAEESLSTLLLFQGVSGSGHKATQTQPSPKCHAGCQTALPFTHPASTAHQKKPSVWTCQRLLRSQPFQAAAPIPCAIPPWSLGAPQPCKAWRW